MLKKIKTALTILSTVSILGGCAADKALVYGGMGLNATTHVGILAGPIGLMAATEGKESIWNINNRWKKGDNYQEVLSKAKANPRYEFTIDEDTKGVLVEGLHSSTVAIIKDGKYWGNYTRGREDFQKSYESGKLAERIKRFYAPQWNPGKKQELKGLEGLSLNINPQ